MMHVPVDRKLPWGQVAPGRRHCLRRLRTCSHHWTMWTAGTLWKALRPKRHCRDIAERACRGFVVSLTFFVVDRVVERGLVPCDSVTQRAVVGKLQRVLTLKRQF